jgi:uncharacterized protein YdeI (YjbR/CyaY-like superfamily)
VASFRAWLRAWTACYGVWENFNRLAPSHRRNYIRWITDAKKPETRERRLRAAIKLLTQNKKLEMNTRISDVTKR